MPGPLYGYSKKEQKKVRKSVNKGKSLQEARVAVMTSRAAPPASSYTSGFRRLRKKRLKKYRQAQRAVKKFAGTIDGPLTAGQRTFINTVAKETGLSPRVIAAQVLAEQSGDAATQREAEGNHNWLNIGYFDDGPDPGITGDAGWRSAKSAGKLTAAFFKGQKFGASQGIRNVLNTAGRSDAEQMSALVNSGWASSGYGGTLQGTYSQISTKPKNVKKYRQAKRNLKIQKKKLNKFGIQPKTKASRDPFKLPGPHDGSQAMVSQLLGQKVKGDKEPGHSPTGYHSIAGAYAQDIGSAGGNAAEGEAGLGYNQQTLGKIVRNLRKKGAKVPDLKIGDNWSGTVKGYDIQLITEVHGSGPHIHLGAKWNGQATGSGVVSGGGAVGGGGATVVSGTAGKRKNRIVSKDIGGGDLLGFINSLDLDKTDGRKVFDFDVDMLALKQLDKKGGKGVSSVKAARKKGAALQIAKIGADKFGLTITSTTGGKHVPGSYHYSGRGVDLAGSAKQMKKFFKWASRYRPTELFYDPAGHYWKNGKKVRGAIGGHSDHVHIAM